MKNLLSFIKALLDNPESAPWIIKGLIALTAGGLLWAIANKIKTIIGIGMELIILAIIILYLMH